jgi:hypothetical protein
VIGNKEGFGIAIGGNERLPDARKSDMEVGNKECAGAGAGIDRKDGAPRPSL